MRMSVGSLLAAGRRRSAAVAVVCIALCGISFYVVPRFAASVWGGRTVLPMLTGDRWQGSIGVRAMINGVPADMSIAPGEEDTSVTETFGNGIGALNGRQAYATIGLGAYVRRRVPLLGSGTAARHAGGPDGIIGADLFTEWGGYAPARVTLDFERREIVVDDRRGRKRHAAPPGSLAVSLSENPAGVWSIEAADPAGTAMQLPLLWGADTLVPEGFLRMFGPVRYTSRHAGLSQPKSIAIVIGGRAFHLTVRSYKGHPELAGLGVDFLRQFRVVMDYRDKLAYLEPPDSAPADD